MYLFQMSLDRELALKTFDKLSDMQKTFRDSIHLTRNE